MDVYKTIGKNMVKRRKQLNMTQLQLAEKCGVNRPYMSNIENGKNQVSCHILINIANHLHVSLEYLVGSFLQSNRDGFNEEIASYCAAVPRERRDDVRVVIKTISNSYQIK